MATRICMLLVLLAVAWAGRGESVDALPSGRMAGRQLRIMDFRLDGLGSTLDFLPPWASNKVKEWFPVFDEQGGGHEEEVSSSRQWPSVRRSGNDLVVSGPQGDLNLVMVPERAESEAVEVAHCTNQPPLGATCQEVVDFDSCSLPVLAENNICDKMCGRCQTSLPGEDSDDSSDQESDEASGDKDVPQDPSESSETNEGSAKEQEAADKESGEGSDCQSLGEFLTSRSDLSVSSLLFQNVKHPLLKAVLEDSFVGTVFVPGNGAFDKLATQLGLSKEQIIGASPRFWDQIIDAHIVPGLPRRKFFEGQEFPTLSARWDIFVKKDKSGELFLESQSGFRAYIKEQDITACSSVIHVLDNIILPVSKEEGIASFEWQAGDPTAGR